jgi:hypothetical protein
MTSKFRVDKALIKEQVSAMAPILGRTKKTGKTLKHRDNIEGEDSENRTYIAS